MNLQELSKKLVRPLITLAVVAALIAAFALGRRTAPEHDPGADVATDPDPHAAHAEHGAGQGGDEGAEVEYVCPMHPQIRRDEPGTCPICHMDLVPVEAGGTEEGDGVIALSEAAVALARVRTEEVARTPLMKTLRLFGRIEASDSGEARVTAWTAGRVERLYVQNVGERVRRGQRLVAIYSPEIVLAQETLIHARRIAREARELGSPTREATAEATARAARTELRLLGLDDDAIDDLVADGVADEVVTIRSPGSGTVTERLVREGDHVERGTPLLALSDLSEVWAQLEVYEQDLPLVREGATVSMRLPGHGGEAISGRVAFIDPVLDPRRRVARARVVLENPAGALRPEMFVEAEVHTEVTDVEGRVPVSVPATAVLWTGERSLVYVHDPVESPPVVMPIEVVLGARVGDRYVIEEGVFPGEEVVVNGAFRIDADLQIRGGDSMMGRGAGGAADPSAGGGHVH
jgi:Cu(I)/Ag(I) efflux system membrane fusion protein